MIENSVQMNINLFCLPFAGASAHSYHHLQQSACEGLHIIPLELPGRGARFAEPLPGRLEAMVSDCYDHIKTMLQQPYAFYGHSMGALLAYLLLQQVAAEQQPLPLHLFVSGFAGPSVAMTKARRETLQRQETVDRVQHLMGEAAAIFKTEAFRVLYEPVIRADLDALIQYEYRSAPPSPVPVTVFAGQDDTITIEESYAWGNETVWPVPVYRFKGGHQFWQQHSSSLLQLMKNHLKVASS